MKNIFKKKKLLKFQIFLCSHCQKNDNIFNVLLFLGSSITLSMEMNLNFGYVRGTAVSLSLSRANCIWNICQNYGTYGHSTYFPPK